MSSALMVVPQSQPAPIPVSLVPYSYGGSQVQTQTQSEEGIAFDYGTTKVGDLKVVMRVDPTNGKPYVDKVLVNEEPLQDSKRFWTSLFARYGFNSAFFKYFDHAEVFSRIAEKEKNDRLRFCVERKVDEFGVVSSKLLAVSNPEKPILSYDDARTAVERYQGSQITYSDGIMESTHIPVRAEATFSVAGDLFHNRFMMATPIDGYGAPNFYLSLLRQVCSNGVVAYAKSFKSSLSLGKGGDEVIQAVLRALEGFNHEEGYAAIRQRMESSASSWASVWETQKLYELLLKLHAAEEPDIDVFAVIDGGRTPLARGFYDAATASSSMEAKQTGSAILKAFHGMTGDTSQLYGLANLDNLSQKRQRTLPVRCTVYDVINFATEVATHYCEPNAARALQALVGTMISGEFDMEGTKDKFSDFADFHIDRKLVAGVTGSN